MDNRPIGVFDSGLGGLTTVKKLKEYLPGENIIYLGDTGRVPYGSRSVETIIKYANQDAAFLIGFNIKAMIIACNTVCSTAYQILEKAYDIPVFEVISAPVRAAIKNTKNNRVGVIGTTATINSSAYEKELKKISPDINVYSKACPLFVPLVENNRTDENDIAALTIVKDYLIELKDSGIDTLIMGCTHYPLLRKVISKAIGTNITLIDSGSQTARFVAEKLKDLDKLSDKQTGGVIKYYITDSINDFSNLASRFLESPVDGMVEQVTLD
jgi:glutamate racemase